MVLSVPKYQLSVGFLRPWIKAISCPNFVSEGDAKDASEHPMPTKDGAKYSYTGFGFWEAMNVGESGLPCGGDKGKFVVVGPFPDGDVASG